VHSDPTEYWLLEAYLITLNQLRRLFSVVKVKLSLCLTKYHAKKTYPMLTKHYATKTYGRMEV